MTAFARDFRLNYMKRRVLHPSSFCSNLRATQYPQDYVNYTDFDLMNILRSYFRGYLNNQHVIRPLNFQEYLIGDLAHHYCIRLNDLK